MENNANIAEILKDCPSGTKFYSPIFGDVYLNKIRPHLAIVVTIDKEQGDFKEEFLYDGRYWINGECMLFPSKDQRDWSKFQIPSKFKDGDIISNGICTCIFNGIENDKFYRFYVGLYNDFFIKNTVILKENIHLATEEEKKKLFDTIREHEYKWNNETKTLEKLIKPKFKVGDKVIAKEGISIPMLITKVGDEFYKVSNDENSVGFFKIKDQDDWEIVPDKFDINNLKPFDRVLVWNGLTEKWDINLFCRFDNVSKLFKTMTGSYSLCIPYEGNEHLFDTDKDCSDYYKTWE